MTQHLDQIVFQQIEILLNPPRFNKTRRQINSSFLHYVALIPENMGNQGIILLLHFNLDIFILHCDKNMKRQISHQHFDKKLHDSLRFM